MEFAQLDRPGIRSIQEINERREAMVFRRNTMAWSLALNFILFFFSLVDSIRFVDLFDMSGWIYLNAREHRYNRVGEPLSSFSSAENYIIPRPISRCSKRVIV